MVKRAAWAGFFDSFVDSAFGGATVVVVPPVVVVFVVVVVDPVVVDPVVLPPVVVLVVVVDDAGGVAFLPDPPPVEGAFAALFVDPRPPLEAVLPLAGEPVLVVVVVVVFGDWPLPFRAPDSTFGWPPLGALPDFPCAATGAPLTATIAATVANVRKTFIWNPPPW